MTQLYFAAVALALFAPGALLAEGKMAHLTIISETHNLPKLEYPHSAVLIEYSDGKQEWLGFMPSTSPLTKPGVIDSSNREKHIASFIRFELDEEQVKKAREAVTRSFSEKKYVVYVTDCVSFTAEFAREVGLKVPAKPNLVPGNLVKNLHELNPGASGVIYVAKVDSTTKLPWAAAASPPPVRLAGSRWQFGDVRLTLGEGKLGVQGGDPQLGSGKWRRDGEQGVVLEWSTNLEPIRLRSYVFRGIISGKTLTGTLTTSGFDPGRQLPPSEKRVTMTLVE